MPVIYSELVVEFVAVKPTMLAIEVLRVLMMPFVKSATEEKREVEVALPRSRFRRPRRWSWRRLGR